MSVGIEILNGQGFHVAEQIIAQPPHGTLADVDHNPVVGKGGHNTRTHQAGPLHNIGGQAAEIPGAAVQHRYDVGVHQSLGEGGGHYSGHCGDQDAH